MLTLLRGHANGRYDEQADIRSTHNMIQLFREIFPDHPPRPCSHNAAGAPINVAVDVRLLDDSGAVASGTSASTTTTTVTEASCRRP